LYPGVLTFQQIQPRLIWNSGTPNTNEYLIGGQAVTLVGRFGQVKRWNLAILRVEFIFMPFIKCVTSCLDLQKGMNCDQNWIHDVHLGY
jgi:hypothetical protein